MTNSETAMSDIARRMWVLEAVESKSASIPAFSELNPAGAG
jgi:hypothetical protein